MKTLLRDDIHKSISQEELIKTISMGIEYQA